MSAETEKKLDGKKIIRLKPLKGGMVSIKQKYPRGDLGYRGDKINELVEKML